MKTIAISLVSSVCVLAALAWPQTTSAQLVFQTTFDNTNFPDQHGRTGHHWETSDYLYDYRGPANTPGYPNKTGIGMGGGWFTALGGKGNQPTGDDCIIAAANYPGGGGGKGFRHWRGDGTNNNGGGLTITLPSVVTEMWVRFYMRYSLGFAWAHGRPHYSKDHNWRGPGGFAFGIQGGGGRWGLTQAKSYPSTRTWAETMGGNTGDGQWHAYEYHVKQNGANSTIEIWVDGVQYLNETAADLGSTGWQTLLLGSNQNLVTGCSPDCYTDYDDIAISTTGYIGPIGTPGPAAPNAARREQPTERK